MLTREIRLFYESYGIPKHRQSEGAGRPGRTASEDAGIDVQVWRRKFIQARPGPRFETLEVLPNV